jgi:hypothetical protein
MEILGTSREGSLQTIIGFSNFQIWYFFEQQRMWLSNIQEFKNYFDPLTRDEHHLNEENRNNHVRINDMNLFSIQH